MHDATLLELHPCPQAPHRVLSLDRSQRWHLWDHRQGRVEEVPGLTLGRWQGTSLVGLALGGRLVRRVDGGWRTPKEAEGRTFQALAALACGWLVVGDAQGVLTVYEGDQAIQLLPLQTWIGGLEPSPAGTRVLVIEDASVSVWDVATEARSARTWVCQDEALGGGWAPDGQAVIGHGLSGMRLIHLPSDRKWDLSAGSSTGHGFSAQLPANAAFSPSGARVAACGIDGWVRVQSLEQDGFDRLTHDGWARGVAWEDEETLWLSGDDTLVRLDARTGETLETLEAGGCPSRIQRLGPWLYTDLQVPERGLVERQELGAWERLGDRWCDRRIRRA